MIVRLLLHVVAAFAARDHRGAMCSRCKDGALVDGGTRTVRGVGCVHWCSHAGYCGDGDSYRRGLDCRHRADVDPETLARATKEAEAQRSARYDATFVRHHGAKTFEQYKRGADHGELYGAAISIRGERHCGTGWVRVMTNENCRERHYWSPKLDADGLYGWKHDFLPESFAAASRDAVVVVFRCAAPWAVKMRKTAYSGAIDRLGRGAGLQAFLSTRFVERGVSYAHVRVRAALNFFPPVLLGSARRRRGPSTAPHGSARRRGGRQVCHAGARAADAQVRAVPALRAQPPQRARRALRGPDG